LNADDAAFVRFTGRLLGEFSEGEQPSTALLNRLIRLAFSGTPNGVYLSQLNRDLPAGNRFRSTEEVEQVAEFPAGAETGDVSASDETIVVTP
jgi:hypothetical protein